MQINYSINGEHSQLFDNVKNDNGTVAGAKRLAALSVKWICCKRKIKNSDKTESSIAVLFGGEGGIPTLRVGLLAYGS